MIHFGANLFHIFAFSTVNLTVAARGLLIKLNGFPVNHRSYSQLLFDIFLILRYEKEELISCSFVRGCICRKMSQNPEKLLPCG